MKRITENQDPHVAVTALSAEPADEVPVNRRGVWRILFLGSRKFSSCASSTLDDVMEDRANKERFGV